MSLPRRDSISRFDQERLAEATAQVGRGVDPESAPLYDLTGAVGDDAVSEPLFGQQTRCARSGCGQTLARRTGPGRPPRFCSTRCRHAARRTGRSTADMSRAVRPRRASRFGEVLRAAVERAGISLQDICDLLQEQDQVTVSRSTLSSWQCGHTPRRGPEEDKRIYALERVLRLRRGELLLLLEEASESGEGRPAQTGGDDAVRALRVLAGQLGGVSNCILIAVEDEMQVVGRKPQHRRIRQVVRAVAANADCYWTIYAPDAAGPDVGFAPVHGCRIGRKIRQGDLIAVELLYDRILQPGETHTFTFQLDEQQLTQPVRDCRRWAGPPALESLRMSVVFDSTPLPRQILACQWDTRDQLTRPGRPVQVVEGVARLNMAHPPAGMYGLRWRW